MAAHLHANVTVGFKLNEVEQLGKFCWQSKQHVVANPQNAKLRHQLHTPEATATRAFQYMIARMAHKKLSIKISLPRHIAQLICRQMQACEIEQTAAPSSKLVNSKF